MTEQEFHNYIIKESQECLYLLANPSDDLLRATLTDIGLTLDRIIKATKERREP